MRLLQEIRTRLGNYHIKSAMFHYYRGEYSQALDYLDRALSAEDLCAFDEGIARYYVAQSHVSAAERHEEQDDPDKAIEEYQHAIASHPEYPDLHFRLGRLQQTVGRLEEAAASLKAAVVAHPDYYEAQLALAFVLLESQDLAGAEAAFRRVHELATATITDPYDRAREALASGDAEAAETWFKEAFIRHPHRFDYHFKRGLKLMRKGQLDESIEHLQQAVAINSKFADVYNYLGVALVERERAVEAEEAFRKSVELNPDYMVAHLNLGFTLGHLGRRREAIEQLRFVLEKEPTNEAVRSKLAELAAEGEASRTNGEGAARHES
jgi:tetratricopeptide (TPR) repeat protein